MSNPGESPPPLPSAHDQLPLSDQDRQFLRLGEADATPTYGQAYAWLKIATQVHEEYTKTEGAEGRNAMLAGNLANRLYDVCDDFGLFPKPAPAEPPFEGKTTQSIRSESMPRLITKRSYLRNSGTIRGKSASRWLIERRRGTPPQGH